jgi:hypothetical protein
VHEPAIAVGLESDHALAGIARTAFPQHAMHAIGAPAIIA